MVVTPAAGVEAGVEGVINCVALRHSTHCRTSFNGRHHYFRLSYKLILVINEGETR